MALSAAEKNRRKRERKKKEKEERRQRELKEKEAKETLLKKEETEKAENEDVEIEYVTEDLSKILGATKPVDTPPQTTSLPDGLQGKQRQGGSPSRCAKTQSLELDLRLMRGTVELPHLIMHPRCCC